MDFESHGSCLTGHQSYVPLISNTQHNNSNNCNNTKVTEDDPFLLDATTMSGQQQLTSEDGTTKVTQQTSFKMQAVHKGKTSVLKQEWRLEVASVTSAKSGFVTKRLYTTTAATNGTQASVFHKWAAVDAVGAPWPLGAMDVGAPQPCTAKRQLSADSSASNLRVMMKSAVTKQGHGGQRDLKDGGQGRTLGVLAEGSQSVSGGHTDTRVGGGPSVTSKRKTKRELYAGEETFSTVDRHAINAGKELRCRGVVSLQTISQTITEAAHGELETLRAIWIWLCHYIDYDVSGYLGLSSKLCTPEEVIKAGKAVCSGYSSVCLHMCQEAGVECREVPGHGKGIGYRQSQSYQNTKSSHMWNAVRLEGHWYLLDACWGAGRVDMDNKTFIKRYDDFYFLTDPEDFINSHCPDEVEWQLLDSPVPLEEFQKRVLRTSHFYTLGLTLLHPQYYSLVTDNGEAMLSMKLSQPVDFTYQITQRNAPRPVEVSCPSGLLTVAQETMRLRLLPRASGTYDVMIFARPVNNSPHGVFSWVCSFQLECLEPKPSEELPGNPFLCWGLQRTAEGLGVRRCSHGSEPATVARGSLRLDLQTSRPLTMLCELSHKDLEASVAARCLATQIQPDRLACHVLCPHPGYYRLSVFVRDYDSPQGSYQNAGNFLLRCTGGGTVNLNDLFPSSLSSSCGPGTRTRDAGLSKFSHTGAVVSAEQGECNITFEHRRADLEIHATLSKDHRGKTPTYPLSRYLFFTHDGHKVTISAVLPECGLYKLRLYAKSPDDQDFSPMCDYILKSSSQGGSPMPPFPCTYTAWRKGSVLFEPRRGLLEPRSWVRFRVRVPGARRVSVLLGLGERLADLHRNNDSQAVWEGDVFTGASGNKPKLLAATGREGGTSSCDMAVVMSFDVLSSGGK